MTNISNKQAITEGKTALGIELGSTRIKAVLIDDKGAPLASGGYGWENRLENGIWTYSLDEVFIGLQGCYRELSENVKEKYDLELSSVGAIGISGMMHGYLSFDCDGKLLTPFRTWRNTITAQAAEALTSLFDFNIPQRWSIAHLYQAMLNKEAHVTGIDYITSLAGYIHLLLTGERVIGIGEASGMFPIDDATQNYNEKMVAKFDRIVENEGYSWHFGSVFPRVLSAGESAGVLSDIGARLLDPTGTLSAGIPLCPPEGDAGTGMVATNSVAQNTGNVSAGTSIFLMAVLEKPLSRVYAEIDMVTTPAGRPVAMVHCNTCTTELNAWVSIFRELLETMGYEVDVNELFGKLFRKALEEDADCGGLLSYNYHAGEPITEFETGALLFARLPKATFNLSNFMRAQLYSCLATLKIGMEILDRENVVLKNLLGHGGFFKTEAVGQVCMSAAMDIPVSVMETAGEGGPWGMALLAAYMKNKAPDESMENYLQDKIFSGAPSTTISADAEAVSGFKRFLEHYKKGLPILRTAVDNL